MKVLVACEYSGTVRDAFLKLGHEAMSCDLLPTDVPGPHYEGDVFDIINEGWDLLIAHPPCTYLCNSGVRWLHEIEGRWKAMEEGAEFFLSLLNCKIPKRAIENPIMHKYAAHIIGSRATQFVQPWMFGHGETKATGFHLINLPKLIPTNIVEERKGVCHSLPPSKDRWKIRSKTYQGIADAMAQQWGQDASTI